MLLYIITWLPLPVIQFIGARIGKLIALIVPKRAKVARRNIELWNPSLTDHEIDALVKENIKRTGMALFETAMGWWWPSWRVRRAIEIEGYEHVEAALERGKGVFGMALHNMNLEFACATEQRRGALIVTRPEMALDAICVIVAYIAPSANCNEKLVYYR